jgi:HlyD family secretion protein
MRRALAAVTRPTPAIAACLIACLCLALAACSRNRPGIYQGYVEGEFVYVASPVGGRLVTLAVERGQSVEADVPLFALESDQEEAEYRQAEERLRSAEAQLADLKKGKRIPEVEVVRAQLTQATATEQQAASDLKRDEAQFAAGGIARGQLEQSQSRHAIAAARVQELTGQLEIARLPARNEQILAQNADVEGERAALANAKWRLDQKRMGAPRAGLVQDTFYREGEWVPAGSPVVKLLPPDGVKIRFFVPETVAGGLQAGRPVAVRCDGCGEEIPGAVSFVATEAEYTPPVIYSNETRAKLVYMIEAKPAEGSGPRLHPGRPVEVSLK